MTDTRVLAGNHFIYFFVYFCGNPGSKVARGVGDSNPRPSDLHPDAMTIRPRRYFFPELIFFYREKELR